MVVGQCMGRGLGGSAATIQGGFLHGPALPLELVWIPDHGGCQPEPSTDGWVGSRLTQLSGLPWPSPDAQVLVQLISGSPTSNASIVTGTAPAYAQFGI